ncbi:MAG: NAD(+) diphosphatase [Actinomycetota bacterium]
MFQPAISVPDHLLDEPGRWFLFDERDRLLLIDGRPPAMVEAPAGTTDLHVLGHDADGPIRAGRLPAGYDPDAFDAPTDDAIVLDLRRAYAVLEEVEWILAGRAAQILKWDADHRFCSRCGDETEPHQRDRARLCPSCGHIAFPRLTPAVITLVERQDGQALLAWGRQFPGRFYSALAGFVEPGETLEQCVVREVKEEVGIDVEDVRYFGSQPWPFPHSLMIGFNASYAGGDLVLQEEEIVEADWFHHEELPPVPRGRMSIAGWLIEDWVARRSGPA